MRATGDFIFQTRITDYVSMISQLAIVHRARDAMVTIDGAIELCRNAEERRA